MVSVNYLVSKASYPSIHSQRVTVDCAFAHIICIRTTTRRVYSSWTGIRYIVAPLFKRCDYIYVYAEIEARSVQFCSGKTSDKWACSAGYLGSLVDRCTPY